MDRIGALLKEISGMSGVQTLERRSSGFLNDVAEIYERHGCGATRAYLLNQLSRRQRSEAQVLLSVLEKLDTCPEVRMNRAIGRQVIKCLYQLKEGARK